MADDVDFAALGFDPSDAQFLADPYPAYERMQACGPVLYYPPRNLFLLTNFADVDAALRDRRLGRAYRHLYSDAEFGQAAAAGRPAWEASERWSLLNLEPPDHTRLRRLVAKVFTARAIARMSDTVRSLAGRQWAGIAAAGGNFTFDLISDYAQPFSVSVICALLGVPQPDGPLLLGWSHAIVKMYEFASTLAEQEAAESAAGEFIGYVKGLIERRRNEPRADLITELVQVADQGDRLTEDEIVCTVIVLLNAGHEATVNTLGNGLRALMLHPRQWGRLVSGAVDSATAVEEMIRWDAPLQLFERWVLAEGVRFGSRDFAVGERIGMMFGAANRDPDRFSDAAAFDIGRGDSAHVGFGAGLHFCIGAPLARLELAASLDLLKTFPGLRMVEMPKYQPYFVIRGLRGLLLSVS